jgi:hypothetical protein
MILAFSNGTLFPSMGDSDRIEFSVQLAVLSLFFAFWYIDLMHEREIVFRVSARRGRAVACVASASAFVISICGTIAVQRAVPTDALTAFRFAIVILLGLLSFAKIAYGAIKCLTLYSWRCEQLERYYESRESD